MSAEDEYSLDTSDGANLIIDYTNSKNNGFVPWTQLAFPWRTPVEYEGPVGGIWTLTLNDFFDGTYAVPLIAAIGDVVDIRIKYDSDYYNLLKISWDWVVENRKQGINPLMDLDAGIKVPPFVLPFFHTLCLYTEMGVSSAERLAAINNIPIALAPDHPLFHEDIRRIVSPKIDYLNRRPQEDTTESMIATSATRNLKLIATQVQKGRPMDPEQLEYIDILRKEGLATYYLVLLHRAKKLQESLIRENYYNID